jgi:hypothetical protein
MRLFVREVSSPLQANDAFDAAQRHSIIEQTVQRSTKHSQTAGRQQTRGANVAHENRKQNQRLWNGILTENAEITGSS